MSTSPRGRRRRRPEEHANHERWLVSYADFITLLFAFFTVLYAISTVDAKKLAAMVDSMQTAFPAGPSPGGQGSAPAAAPGGGTPASTSADLAVLQDRLEGTLARAIADKRVDVERRGDRGDVGSRSRGVPRRQRRSRPTRALLMDVRLRWPNDLIIRVEGYTDDTPFTPRGSPRTGSLTTRATNVIAFSSNRPACGAVLRRRLRGHPRADNTSK